MIKPTKHRPASFSLRTMLALTAGAAFIAFATQWLISMGVGDTPLLLILLVVPWVVGSLAGIAIADRRDRSTLAGAIIGGTLGTSTCPGLFLLYLYANDLNGVRSLSGLWWQLAFAACGSGLLAAFIDIPRQGLTLRRNRKRTLL